MNQKLQLLLASLPLNAHHNRNNKQTKKFLKALKNEQNYAQLITKNPPAMDDKSCFSVIIMDSLHTLMYHDVWLGTKQEIPIFVEMWNAADRGSNSGGKYQTHKHHESRVLILQQERYEIYQLDNLATTWHFRPQEVIIF